MKGLVLAERYFLAHGVSLIRREFPDYRNRIAAGLVGPGSDCLGFDDDVSKDHDWGPGFCLWLTDSDFEDIGEALTTAYESLPASFEGFDRSQSEWGGGRVGVYSASSFYQRYIGSSEAPVQLLDWLCIPDDNLSVCTSGKVFSDPLGEFVRVRNELLAYFPDDVRLVKIAARCMSAGQSGQYNYQRCRKRFDRFSMQSTETGFCSDIISIVYLINRKYKPYYKWQLVGVADLPISGREIAKLIVAFLAETDPLRKQPIINHICEVIIGALRIEGLSDSDSPHLLDHGAVIHDTIFDAELRRRDVWLG